jgi:uncharacterized protein YndB with AHSA1/START domain
MKATSGPILRVTRKFEASAERVFDAWLNPATVGKWLFATPAGQMVRCEIDPRVGGKFLITERRDGEDVDHTGRYLEIERPRRLVFTFAVPKYSSQETRVSLDISPQGDECELSLTHESVLPEWADKTQEGWTKILGALAEELGDAGDGYGELIEEGTLRFERLLPGPIERVWAYLTESDKRAKWLASGEMEPRAGTPVNLKFYHSSLSRKTAPVPEQFKNAEEGQETEHTVTRWEPPRLLSITWGSGKNNQPSEVTFELTPQGKQVQLVLTHRLLRDRKAMLAVGPGWHSHLTVLVERLNEREPEAFWAIFTRMQVEYGKRLP